MTEIASPGQTPPPHSARLLLTEGLIYIANHHREALISAVGFFIGYKLQASLRCDQQYISFVIASAGMIACALHSYYYLHKEGSMAQRITSDVTIALASILTGQLGNMI